MNSKTKSFLNIFLLWLVCFVTHGLLMNFTRNIIVYNDEVLYYDIAQSLWNSGERVVHLIPTDFHKDLFSYLLAPTFIISSARIRMLVIGWLCSFIMSLGVIPASLLIQRFVQNKRLRIFASVLTITMSCMMFSMGVMCEIVLFPLTLLFFYLLVLMEDTKTHKNWICRLIPAAFAGITLYMLYWNKEICLYAVIAFAVYAIYRLCTDNDARTISLLQIILVTLFFVGLYVVLNRVLYSNLSNSYAGVVSPNTTNLGRIGFTAYFGFYNCNYFIAAFGVLPVLIPLAIFPAIEKSLRGYYIFLFTAVITCIGAISYIISSTEDYGCFAARLHLRYAEPMILIGWILFLHIFETYHDRFVNYTKSISLITTGYLSLWIIFAFRFDDATSCITETSLQWYSFLTNALCNTGFSLFTQDFASFLLRLIFACFCGVLVYILLKKSNRFVPFLMIGVITLSLANNAFCYFTFRHYYECGSKDAKAYDKADDYFWELDGNILFVINEKDINPRKLIDTYIDRDVYQVSIQQIENLTDYTGGIFDLNEKSIPTLIPYQTTYTQLTNVDYLVTFGTLTVLDATEITDWPLKDWGYRLWIPDNPSMLHFEYEYEDLYEEPEDVMGMEMSL